MRLMERRKNNAKIKSKFKRDILGSPHILAYLGRPVSVSSSLFSIQFNTPSVLKLTFVMNKQLLNISSLFKLSFTLLKVESKNTSDRFPSLTNDVTQTNNKNYECECSKACFFVNLKTQSSLGWKDQGTPFSHDPTYVCSPRNQMHQTLCLSEFQTDIELYRALLYFRP